MQFTIWWRKRKYEVKLKTAGCLRQLDLLHNLFLLCGGIALFALVVKFLGAWQYHAPKKLSVTKIITHNW